MRSFYKRKNKYGNKTCRCWRDHFHDSIFEANYCNDLNALQKAGEIRAYRSQVLYEFYVKNKRITGHIVDFLVVKNDGSREVHEVKGFATAVWQLKKNLFEALYPKIPYIVIRGRKGL